MKIVEHLENVFKMLDKTRTDDNILILVKPDKSNVKLLEKGVMRIDQKNAGDATIIYPNGGFQIYQKSNSSLIK